MKLDDALGREEVTRNPRGLSLLIVALLMIAGIVVAIAQDTQAVSQSLAEIAQSLLGMIGW
jgi:archaellum component FlaG (FlaF/FlaG flagellin family)